MAPRNVIADAEKIAGNAKIAKKLISELMQAE